MSWILLVPIFILPIGFVLGMVGSYICYWVAKRKFRKIGVDID